MGIGEIGKFIDWLITLIVVVWAIAICVWTGRWFVLPILETFDKNPPRAAWRAAWLTFADVLRIFVQVTGIFVLALYILWRILCFILNKIPIIGKIIRRFLQKIPPIRQFEAVGLFPLLDDIINALFNFGLPWVERFELIALAFPKFWNRVMWRVFDMVEEFMNMFFEKTGGEPIALSRPRPIDYEPVSDIQVSANRMGYTGEEQDEEDIAEMKREEITPTEDQLAVNKLYQMCIAENSVPIYPDDDEATKVSKKKANDLVETTCTAKKISSTIEMISYRM